MGVLGYTLLTAGSLMLVARRHHPVAVLAGTFAVTLWYSSSSSPRGPIWFSLIVALFSAIKYGYRWAAVASVVAGYVSFLWFPPLVGPHKGPSVADAFGLAAWLLVLLFAGEAIRARSQRVAALARSREEEARRQVSDERLRIARELHDVVAHNISLINVQAATALHLIERQPERARDALATIKEVSKEALVELRSVLGVLRQVDEDLPRTPAPTLGRLDELIARTSQAGIEVRLDRRGPMEGLSSPVDQAAYRITQEALTNVARHSGAARATVRIVRADGGLVVEVEDDGHGSAGSPASSASGGGNGIAGMRERARALGGNLQAGPRVGGGYRVRAWLPLPDDQSDDRRGEQLDERPGEQLNERR
jgi:signal transduction histidine kinase